MEHKFIKCKFDLLAKKRRQKSWIHSLSAAQLSKCLTDKYTCPCCLLPACRTMLGRLEECQARLRGEEGVLNPAAAEAAQALVLPAVAAAFTPVEQLPLFAF